MKDDNLLQIIDWECKGNVVRFYLGKNGKQWGDDWNDRPYEHNAGRVYEEFVIGIVDMAFDFDYSIFEPSDGHNNSDYCKEDMIKRKVPCLTICKLDGEFDDKNRLITNFEQARTVTGSRDIFFGDSLLLLRHLIVGRIIGADFWFGKEGKV